jgi:hypothetical protein
MKIVYLLFITLFFTQHLAKASNTQDNSDLYQSRVLQVLDKRKVNMIKKLAAKVDSPYEEIIKNMNFKLNDNKMLVFGHIVGSYGVCEINGEISVIETSVAGKCITADQRVSIIWP